jgi:hypothetical protein
VCRYFEVHHEGRRSIGHDLTEGSTASEGSLVDVAHIEAADAELVRMIERRSRNTRKAGRAVGNRCRLEDRE